MNGHATPTVDANESVARVHDRMPVILPMDAIDTWLTGSPDEARALLKPYEGAVRCVPWERS